MNYGSFANNDEIQQISPGIPTAIFVEDVEYYMSKDENKDAELVLTRLDEQFGKYKFMEMSISRKKKILQKQLPDIKASLDMLKILKIKKEKEEITDTHFMLNDTLYARAKVPPTDKIGLWLGANIMLEYDLEDAEDFLSKNFKAAINTLSQIDTDLNFLREQLTTIEVNMARIYNWNVKQNGREPQ